MRTLHGFDIAADGAGNAYITGFTESKDFPTKNALHAELWYGFLGFVTKLSADGNKIIYSTYFGVNYDSSNYNGSVGEGIAIDINGNAYITGTVGSSFLPTSATDPNIISYDSTYNGGGDAFIAKLSAGDTLHSPLDNQSSTLMKGRVRGECLVGGYCARSTDTSAHNGIDYAVTAGTPVYAICDGVVKLARTKTTTPNIWNRFTIINHSKGCGFESLWAYYGHIEATVTAGQQVSTGQQIGTVANWGKNSHLHLSMNSAYKSSGWGYVNVGESTASDCNEISVVRRRDLLADRGWKDPAILGINSGWNPFLLQGGVSAGNCNAPKQSYRPAPIGDSLPYYPWKTP
jgi:hypothetical protein